jgi:hypothetical protein
MKYKVVKQVSLARLEEEVSELINGGWQLQGGVAATVDSGGTIFYQAMTKSA